MGWEEYYKDHVATLSFRDHEEGYRRAIHYLLRHGSITEDKSNFVLGGFFPQEMTFGAFVNFCRDTFGEPSHDLIAMDMNRIPLEYGREHQTPGVRLVQGDITRFPFGPATIDVIFLDCTVEFLSPEALQKLSQCLAIALKPQGLVLNAFHPVLLRPFERLIATNRHRVKHYSYSAGRVKGLLGSSLRMCYEGDCKSSGTMCPITYDIQGYCREEARYPLFTGAPFCLGD